jgi:hypothetical protein
LPYCQGTYKGWSPNIRQNASHNTTQKPSFVMQTCGNILNMQWERNFHIITSKIAGIRRRENEHLVIWWWPKLYNYCQSRTSLRCSRKCCRGNWKVGRKLEEHAWSLEIESISKWIVQGIMTRKVKRRFQWLLLK